MKKENRQMAQQRRAEERQRQEAQKKRKKILMIAVPVILVLIVLIVLIADAVRSDSSDTTSETTVAEALGYSDDPSLTVEDGDMLHIDYTGTIDGEEFAGGSTDGAGAYLVVGSGSYIDDFEEQLIGAHPGDEVEVNVTFPEDYGTEELAGKDAVFMVTVNGIYG